MEPKPIWLLDVDGVINSPLRKLPTKVWPNWLTDHVWSGRDRWPIHMAVQVRDYIATVHELGLVEIRWHTTWQETANNISRTFNLPEFPVHPSPEFVAGSMYTHQDNLWWKAPAAVRVLLEGRPLLWTDDDLDLLPKHNWAVFRAAGAELIRPDGGTGLTPANLQTIDRFITGGQLLTHEPALLDNTPT